jgi:hypothetical protein
MTNDHVERLERLLADKAVVEESGPRSDKGQQWFAEVHALMRTVDPSAAAQFRHLMQYIVIPFSSLTAAPLWANMLMTVRSAVETGRLAIGTRQERVYGPGDAYDVYRDLSQLVQAVKDSLFVVDPYANEEVFDLYLDKVSAGVSIRLLTGRATPSLQAVARKFALRPQVKFEGRYTDQVHDRVIFVDNSECWVLGQSIKDAANKKPTYMIPLAQEAVSDMAKLYENAWKVAHQL